MYTLPRPNLLLWIFVTILLSTLLNSKESFGHRLRVFAYTEGAEVVVEASFGDKRPIINGGVKILNPDDNQLVTEGQTNQQGIFRFAKPQVEPGSSLKVIVFAGQGHQANWILTPEDLGSPLPQAATPTASSPSATPQNSTRGMPENAEDLAILVEQAVAREIAPLKKMMAEQLTSGPSMTEVIGGIGWIVGIAGLLLAFKKNKRQG